MRKAAPSPTFPAIELAIDRGLAHLAGFQTESGSLRGDFDGPLFLTPGYVFSHHATGTEIPAPQRTALISYLEEVQNKDGGFGLHIEGPSILFTTVLNYVALRLLGAQSPTALEWIRRNGGALAIPSWGKYWLAIMRLYDWREVNPLPPELWLLPRWFPAHPARFWCHCRLIYLPLSYLYGRRWQIPDDPLISTIREEIFISPAEFRHARTLVRSEELYVPHSRPLRLLNAVLATVEPRTPRRLRRAALAEVLEHLESEEATTAFIALGPVNKALNAVALHAAASPLARPAMDALPRYLFDGERGLTMSAYESSELWDTAFAAQAVAAAERVEGEFAARAHAFVSDSQIQDDPPNQRRYHRDRARGGWPFSTRDQGWPVSDCTGEGLAAALALGTLPRERIGAAVDLLLGSRNANGSWSGYERRRGHPWLEVLNGSELFKRIMTDYPSVEPTASAICAVVAARPLLEGHREAEIARALTGADRFIRRQQRSDGSWLGDWGICFTYGTWFAVRGLTALGAGPQDPALQAAVRFLAGKQLPDGGWGESWESCIRGEYIHHPDGSQSSMTAWALLALLQSGVPGTGPVIDRGIQFLLSTQLDDGDWPHCGVTGVFNRTCMLNYRFYRNIFPIWALALSRHLAHPLEARSTDATPR